MAEVSDESSSCHSLAKEPERKLSISDLSEVSQSSMIIAKSKAEPRAAMSEFLKQELAFAQDAPAKRPSLDMPEFLKMADAEISEDPEEKEIQFMKWA